MTVIVQLQLSHIHFWLKLYFSRTTYADNLKLPHVMVIDFHRNNSTVKCHQGSFQKKYQTMRFCVPFLCMLVDICLHLKTSSQFYCIAR